MPQCPNQLRSHGVIVVDIPIHLAMNGNSTHSLYFLTEDVRLPLEMHGCISYLPTRLPSQEEIVNCTWLELTSDMEWDPYATEFKQQEDLSREKEEPFDSND